MFPGSIFAALILIALVPGYAYLRLSEDARRPRDHSALGEFLEVAAVGLGTTGLAALVFVLGWPAQVFDTTSRALDGDPYAARRALAVAGLIAVMALGIAFLGALLTRSVGQGSYSPNVWRSTLGLRHERHLPYVAVDLREDAGRISGVLHSYTSLDGDHPRDIALLAPLTVTREGRSWDPGAAFVVVPSDEIQKIWLTFAPDPGQPVRRRFPALKARALARRSNPSRAGSEQGKGS